MEPLVKLRRAILQNSTITIESVIRLDAKAVATTFSETPTPKPLQGKVALVLGDINIFSICVCKLLVVHGIAHLILLTNGFPSTLSDYARSHPSTKVHCLKADLQDWSKVEVCQLLQKCVSDDIKARIDIAIAMAPHSPQQQPVPGHDNGICDILDEITKRTHPLFDSEAAIVLISSNPAQQRPPSNRSRSTPHPEFVAGTDQFVDLLQLRAPDLRISILHINKQDADSEYHVYYPYTHKVS